MVGNGYSHRRPWTNTGVDGPRRKPGTAAQNGGLQVGHDLPVAGEHRFQVLVLAPERRYETPGPIRIEDDRGDPFGRRDSQRRDTDGVERSLRVTKHRALGAEHIGVENVAHEPDNGADSPQRGTRIANARVGVFITAQALKRYVELAETDPLQAKGQRLVAFDLQRAGLEDRWVVPLSGGACYAGGGLQGAIDTDPQLVAASTDRCQYGNRGWGSVAPQVDDDGIAGHVWMRRQCHVSDKPSSELTDGTLRSGVSRFEARSRSLVPWVLPPHVLMLCSPAMSANAWQER